MPDDEQERVAELVFSHAERLLKGDATGKPDPAQALSFYQQAADLGLGRAHLRMGDLQAKGLCGPADLSKALKAYKRAADAGEFVAFASMARMLERTEHWTQATEFWGKFFHQLGKHEQQLADAEILEAILAYLIWQISRGETPARYPVFSLCAAHVRAYSDSVMSEVTNERQRSIVAKIQDWLEHHPS
jgi:TPR repeat protein